MRASCCLSASSTAWATCSSAAWPSQARRWTWTAPCLCCACSTPWRCAACRRWRHSPEMQPTLSWRTSARWTSRLCSTCATRTTCAPPSSSRCRRARERIPWTTRPSQWTTRPMLTSPATRARAAPRDALTPRSLTARAAQRAGGRGTRSYPPTDWQRWCRRRRPPPASRRRPWRCGRASGTRLSWTWMRPRSTRAGGCPPANLWSAVSSRPARTPKRAARCRPAGRPHKKERCSHPSARHPTPQPSTAGCTRYARRASFSRRALCARTGRRAGLFSKTSS
mmetsp:Transcript_8303/g.20921  ORF Transcript_8303/g.20921 Transcript_8303/m.20921 type:complete len:281 (-) Transcript_8303:356-1198(-)